jgi:nicotinate phosphoribosyltransferase
METLVQLPHTSPATVADFPAVSDRCLSHGLDYYKPTMSQLAYVQEPDAEVTFTFHNRGSQRLMDYVRPEELQERFDEVRRIGWTAPELKYLGGIVINGGDRAFSPQYLEYLATHSLPEVEVRHDAATDDLAIETTGPWPLVTFWETEMMSDVSETYFKQYIEAKDLNIADVHAEGDRRLSDFIALMKQHPDIRFSDFGTRRRFSLDWQRHVLGRLIAECPASLNGTSNVGLASEFDIPVIGTFAHEMPMVYAGLADARSHGDPQAIRSAPNRFFNDWYRQYGPAYATALTDTYGSNFFFKTFGRQLAGEYGGVRHDSGDPFGFGKKLLQMYQGYGIDAHTKSAVYSDALDGPKVVGLHEAFHTAIRDNYGIGTFLTNNLGQKALNVVAKATRVYDPATGTEAGTVKLSDDTGKHTGSPEDVRRYQQIFAV